LLIFLSVAGFQHTLAAGDNRQAVQEFSAALNRIYGIQASNVGGTTIQNKHFIETAHELSTHHEDQMRIILLAQEPSEVVTDLSGGFDRSTISNLQPFHSLRRILVDLLRLFKRETDAILSTRSNSMIASDPLRIGFSSPTFIGANRIAALFGAGLRQVMRDVLITQVLQRLKPLG